MRTIDAVNEDFAHASSDEERASLIRESRAIMDDIAESHQRAGDVEGYQRAAGFTHQAHRSVCVDTARVLKRIERGEL